MWQVHCKPQRIYASVRSWRDTGDTLGTCDSRIVVDFFYFKIKGACGCHFIKGIANKWRKQYDFNNYDMLVLDGDLIELVGRFRQMGLV